MANKNKVDANYKKLIEDAELIKKVSINQAKAMLAEAFQPSIRRILTKNISETEDTIGSPADADKDSEKEGEPLNQSIPTSTNEAEDLEDYEEKDDMNEEDEEMNLEEPSDEEDDKELEEILSSISEQDDEEEIEDLGDESGTEELSGEDEISDFGDEKEDIVPEQDEDMEDHEEPDGDEVYPDLGDEEPGDEDEEINEIINKINETINRKPRSRMLPVRELKSLRIENSRLKTKLHEVNRSAKILHKKLNETALMNAKLAYAYSLMSNYSLTKPEKLMVIERLDEANTIQETRLVHKSLNESFKMLRNRSNGSSKNVKKLTESIKLDSNKDQLNETVTSLRDQIITPQRLQTWKKLANLNESK
jgi:hypothetical protein